MKKFLRDQKGIILIWFYLLIVMIIVAGGSLFALAFQESLLTNIEIGRHKAFYLAEAGLDRKLKELRGGDQNPRENIPFGEGTYSAYYCPKVIINPQTTCALAPPCGCNKPDMIVASGTVGEINGIAGSGITRSITAVVTKTKPPGAKAAITAVDNVSFNGNITVDGREHNSAGELIVGEPGTYGVSSGGLVTQGGSSMIGGIIFEPAQPAHPLAIEEDADNSFTSPEEILGVPAGSLDSYQTSSIPTLPMSGIVYYTGDSWIAPDFGTAANPSTGILIVHNSSGTAFLKNVHGYFTGLIIADDLIHINGDAVVTGAVVLEKQTGNTLGNGAAHVNYSSEVLLNLPTGNYSILSWEDEQNNPYTYL
ncbi:MAG: hypothetical protein HY583_02690 [Candidatus Omnitrophica bacterium]|nr:hypothetical protein [Candidatus Omnitrophota bacterium]